MSNEVAHSRYTRVAEFSLQQLEPRHSSAFPLFSNPADAAGSQAYGGQVFCMQEAVVITVGAQATHGKKLTCSKKAGQQRKEARRIVKSERERKRYYERLG
jgi:hypothetical protein